MAGVKKSLVVPDAGSMSQETLKMSRDLAALYHLPPDDSAAMRQVMFTEPLSAADPGSDSVPSAQGTPVVRATGTTRPPAKVQATMEHERLQVDAIKGSKWLTVGAYALCGLVFVSVCASCVMAVLGTGEYLAAKWHWPGLYAFLTIFSPSLLSVGLAIAIALFHQRGWLKGE